MITNKFLLKFFFYHPSLHSHTNTCIKPVSLKFILLCMKIIICIALLMISQYSELILAHSPRGFNNFFFFPLILLKRERKREKNNADVREKMKMWIQRKKKWESSHKKERRKKIIFMLGEMKSVCSVAAQSSFGQHIFISKSCRDYFTLKEKYNWEEKKRSLREWKLFLMFFL